MTDTTRYFVMLQTQAGWVTPLVDEDGNVAGFDSESEAGIAAASNALGEAFGFEVYEARHD